MFLGGLWDVSLNGDLIEISQRHLMLAGYEGELIMLVSVFIKKGKQKASGLSQLTSNQGNSCVGKLNFSTLWSFASISGYENTFFWQLKK